MSWTEQFEIASGNFYRLANITTQLAENGLK